MKPIECGGNQYRIGAIWIATVYLCFTSCLLLSPNAHAQQNKAILDRLKTEAPSKWSDCAEYYSHRQENAGSLTRYDLRDGRHLTERNTFQMKSNDSCWLWIYQDCGPKETVGRCLCKNARYAFELKRRSESASWALVDFHTAPDVPSKYMAADARGKKVGPIWLDNTWLPDYSREPGFAFTEATSETRGDVETVRAHFSYSPLKNAGRYVRDGWIELDPARYWCVLQFSVVVVSGLDTVTVTGTNEFRDERPGFPKLVRYIRRIQGAERNGSPFDDELVNEYGFEDRSVTDREFTLGAFGLPEPIGFEPQSSVPVYLWFLAAGGVCGLGTIGVRYLARRRHAHTVA